LVVNSYYFDARFYFNVSSFVLIGFYDYFGWKNGLFGC
jgi:hypothetical protein